jgi:radical SAM superfamily enzyme YgiQ (UPF0313 family)
MGIKVLFLYPNTYGMNMIPPAIALFSAILKKKGHKIEIFDTTYYQVDSGTNYDKAMEKQLAVLPSNMESRGIKMKTTSWKDDIKKRIIHFKPDLIAISATEDMWKLGVKLLCEIKDYKIKNNVPVIAGGVFPTFAPEIVSKEELVDLLCIGEGENTLVDICDKIQNKKDYSDVTNIWVKKNGKVVRKNPISKPVDINQNPILDLDLFDENRLYRPMGGAIYKMFPVETIRGCPYTCRFCNSPDQITLYNKETKGGFFRKKRMDLVSKELKHFKNNLGVEYIMFWADTFLAMNKDEFEEFCDMYSEIKIPFWIQTRPETINDYNIKKLVDVGLDRISFGIEHGNEKFRREIIDRRWSNENIIESLKIPNKYEVKYTLNNITGFPTETKKLAFDTIELNRSIDATNSTVSTFVPYHGTPLRKLCEKLGLIKPETLVKSHAADPDEADVGQLNMLQYPPYQIKEIRKCFNLYVKFPKNRWKEIEKAEKNDAEGDRIYNNLKQEFIEKYMPTPNADPHGGVEDFTKINTAGNGSATV